MAIEGRKGPTAPLISPDTVRGGGREKQRFFPSTQTVGRKTKAQPLKLMSIYQAPTMCQTLYKALRI